MDVNVALQREIEYWPPGASQPVPVRVRIGVPQPHPKYEWESTLTLEGFPGRPAYSIGMAGTDPVQAISYALAIAPLHLRLMRDRGGRLTWKGNADLRFPSMFSEPSQDWQWTPLSGGDPRKLGIRIGLPERIDDQWSVLVTCTDCQTWDTTERRVEASAWPDVLERAVTTVRALLQEKAQALGEGTLEELHPSPACGVSP